MAKPDRPLESNPHTLRVVRTQTGVRIEDRMLKVLKALAVDLDMSLGDLLEGIVLHAFEGKPAFSPRTLEKIRALRQVYHMDYGAEFSHRLFEDDSPE